MPSVTVVSSTGVEKQVSTLANFNIEVYGRGARPKVGTVETNIAFLTGKGPAPRPVADPFPQYVTGDELVIEVSRAVEAAGGGSGAPDASTSVKGKLRLAGPLAGTADAPTVFGLSSTAALREYVQDTIADTVIPSTYDDPAGKVTVTGVGGGSGSGTSAFRYLEDFGAVGDGVTDDTAAITAAKDAGLAGKVLVAARGKRYRHTGVVTFAESGITVTGGGRFVATDPTKASVTFTGSNVTVDDFSVEVVRGSSARLDPYAAQALLFKGCTNLFLRDVGSLGSAATQIFLTGVTDARLVNCWGKDSLADGLHVTGGSRRVKILDWRSEKPGDDGAATVSYEERAGQFDGGLCTDIEWVRPSVSGQIDKGRGIAVVGGKDVKITGFRTSTTWGPGLYFGCEPYGDHPTYGIDGVEVTGGIIRKANQKSVQGPDGSILIASSRGGTDAAGNPWGIARATVEDVAVFDTKSSSPWEVGAYTENGGVLSAILLRKILITNPATAPGGIVYVPASVSAAVTRQDIRKAPTTVDA